MAYRLNPSWCVSARFAYPDPSQILRVGDLALLLTVIGHLTTRAPDSRNVDAFEENLRDSVRVSHVNVERFDIEVETAQVRHDLAMRTKADVVEAAKRLLPIRNRGNRMFESVTVGEASIVFRLAFGDGALTAHPYFAQRVTRLPIRRAGNAAYADRAFTIVDPTLVTGFAAPSSVLPYMRLRTWLTSPCRDGLPHMSSYTYDDQGRLRVRLPGQQIADRLGVDMARGTASYIRTFLQRVSRDLIKADIDMRFHPARPRANAVLEAAIASAVNYTLEQERDVGETRFRDPVYPKPPGHIRFAKSEPVGSTPIVMPVAVEVEPEPEPVDRPPTRLPPSRVRLALVPKADVIDQNPPSPVTSVDDVVSVGEEYEWTEEDEALEEAREETDDYTRDPEVEVDEPVATDDDDAPVFDLESNEIPPDERPHRRPVYDAEGRDQHGFNRDGYGRDGKHWQTYLLVDEIRPGVKKPGAPVTVTHFGVPPTDRDKWTATKEHPYCPPAKTPYWCAQDGLWMSVPRDDNWAQHRFPLYVWQKFNRYDVDLWHIDPVTLTTVRTYEPKATRVADWPAILDYRNDITRWADERPTDLGDLPEWYVIEPGYDILEVMAHCRRNPVGPPT